MRLLNYGLGEILDRLSILALKISYGIDRSKDVSAFIRERDALLPKVTMASWSGPILEQYTTLAVVNARLWQAEDELRGWRDRGIPVADLPPTVAQIAYRIQQLNDARSALVRAINALTGDQTPPEKLDVD